MGKKIYIIRGGGTRKESVNIRIDNLFQSFDSRDIMNIEVDFWPKNLLLKLSVILFFSIKALFLVPRNSVVFFNIALLKASIPALLCKKLKSCILIGDYDDTTFGNTVTINDFDTIINKQRSFLDFGFWELISVKEANFIVTISQNLMRFVKKVRGESFKNLIYIPNAFDEEKFPFHTSKINKKELNVPKDKIIVGYIGFLEINADFFNFLLSISHINDLYFIFILNIPNKEVEKMKYFLRENNICNVGYMGGVPHSEIPGYMTHFDIGLDSTVIYDISLDGFQINSRSGAKIKEFLSLNIPILCMNSGEASVDIGVAYPHKNNILLIDNKEEMHVTFSKIDQSFILDIKSDYDEDFRIKYSTQILSKKFKESLRRI